MPSSSPNMGLTLWDATDPFNYLELRNNFSKIDSHVHTETNNQIPNAGLQDGAVTNAKVSSTAAIAANKIAGTAITQTTAAGGSLVGTYPNPTLKDRTVARINIERGIVPDIINGDANGTNLPTGLTSADDGYTIDYNFSKQVGSVQSGTVTAATYSSSNNGTYTYTVSSHGFLPGDYVTVTGITGTGTSNFNITKKKISSVTPTTFVVQGTDSYTPYNNSTTLSSATNATSQSATFTEPYEDSGNIEYFSWRMRYNGSTQKWDCLGGTPIAYTYVGNPTLEALTSNYDPPTVPNGLSVDVPFKGNYLISSVVTGRYYEDMKPAAKNMTVYEYTSGGTYGTLSATNLYPGSTGLSSPTSTSNQLVTGIISYAFGTTIYKDTTEITTAGNARAYATSNQTISGSTVGAGSEWATASTIYKGNLNLTTGNTKRIRTGFWKTDGGAKLTITSQSIVITPISGLGN